MCTGLNQLIKTLASCISRSCIYGGLDRSGSIKHLPVARARATEHHDASCSRTRRRPAHACEIEHMMCMHTIYVYVYAYVRQIAHASYMHVRCAHAFSRAHYLTRRHACAEFPSLYIWRACRACAEYVTVHACVHTQLTLQAHACMPST